MKIGLIGLSALLLLLVQTLGRSDGSSEQQNHPLRNSSNSDQVQDPSDQVLPKGVPSGGTYVPIIIGPGADDPTQTQAGDEVLPQAAFDWEDDEAKSPKLEVRAGEVLRIRVRWSMTDNPPPADRIVVTAKRVFHYDPPNRDLGGIDSDTDTGEDRTREIPKRDVPVDWRVSKVRGNDLIKSGKSYPLRIKPSEDNLEAQFELSTRRMTDFPGNGVTIRITVTVENRAGGQEYVSSEDVLVKITS